VRGLGVAAGGVASPWVLIQEESLRGTSFRVPGLSLDLPPMAVLLEVLAGLPWIDDLGIGDLAAVLKPIKAWARLVASMVTDWSQTWSAAVWANDGSWDAHEKVLVTCGLTCRGRFWSCRPSLGGKGLLL